MTHFTPFTLQDRGLAYGDGLFETLRLSRGHLHWWPEHYARMSHTCAALGLPSPQADDVRAAIDSAVDKSGSSEAVVKLIYTAGSGLRGYLREEPLAPALAVLIAEVPATPRQWPAIGLTVGLLQQSACAPVPALSGLKHLNRLPQVLARAAWPDGVDECLIHDGQGLVSGGTQGNFFWQEHGRWHTPPIGGSAIAGTVRALLCRYFHVTIAPLSTGRLALAEAAVMTNAVRGVMPIGCLAGRALSLDPARELAACWQKLCADQATRACVQPADTAWFALQHRAEGV